MQNTNVLLSSTNPKLCNKGKSSLTVKYTTQDNNARKKEQNKKILSASNTRNNKYCTNAYTHRIYNKRDKFDKIFPSNDDSI